MKEKVSSILACLMLLASVGPVGSSKAATTTGHYRASTQATIPAALTTVAVTTTADSGPGSLREAINTANGLAGTTIQFNIPTSDPNFDGKVFTINLESSLPDLTKEVTIIDGATQTAATGDTNPQGPEVIIDGILAPSTANGFIIKSNSNQIRNLTISDFFGGAGITISGAVKSNIIADCYIGTDSTGTTSAGNQTGIRIIGGASSNTIGGLVADGNLISGNIGEGILISGTGSDANTIAGNVIGVDASSSRNQLPNLGEGILINSGAKANTIGGADKTFTNIIAGNLRNGILVTGTGTSGNIIKSNQIGTFGLGVARGNGQAGIAIVSGAANTIVGGDTAGNAIAFNASNGVTVGSANTAAASQNTISRNSIFSNGGLGIDLGNDGVTKNDANDADTGSNGFLNYPEITNVTAAAGKVTIEGTLSIASPETATVEIFASTMPSPGLDPSGFGEGQTFMTSVKPNAAGLFTATVTSPANVSISTTTTDANGNTSEFSPVFQLGGGQPDLIVSDLTATPQAVTAGGNITLQFSIRNQGTSSASGAQHSIFLSTDNVFDSKDLVLGSVATNALPPNTNQTFQLDVKIPADGPSGAVFVGVVADAGATITESLENNNSANTALNVQLLPDLIVNNLSINKSTANPGDNLRVQFNVQNQGSSNTGAHTQEVRLSTDNIIDNNDVLLSKLSSNGINANSSSQFVIDVQVPPATTPGSYFIGVTTDSEKTIAEINETNNTSTTSLMVSGSVDLQISDLTVAPNSGGAGSQVAVSFKLNNVGTLSVPASTVDVRLSNNQTIDGSDTLLGSVPAQTIAAGGSVTLTFTANLPATLPPGNTFIGVIADSQAVIAESNENNNTASAVFSVSDLSAPAVTLQSPNGNDVITSGSDFTIKWTASDDTSVTTQDIYLSLDGGNSYNQVIVTGLPGTANTFVWSVPALLNSGQARIQIVARDSQGNVGKDTSDNNFAIGLRPTLTNPTLVDGKFKINAAGSNIDNGATLVVVNGTSRETFVLSLSANGAKYVVKGNSSPSGLKLNKAFPKGVPVQLIVRNSNGIESLPVTFQR